MSRAPSVRAPKETKERCLGKGWTTYEPVGSRHMSWVMDRLRQTIQGPKGDEFHALSRTQMHETGKDPPWLKPVLASRARAAARKKNSDVLPHFCD